MSWPIFALTFLSIAFLLAFVGDRLYARVRFYDPIPARGWIGGLILVAIVFGVIPHIGRVVGLS